MVTVIFYAFGNYPDEVGMHLYRIRRYFLVPPHGSPPMLALSTVKEQVTWFSQAESTVKGVDGS